MGVTIYLTKRGRKNCHIESGGYSILALARSRMLSRFSLEAGAAYFCLPECRDNLQNKTLEDISPYVPKELWPLFTASDCDDPKFSHEECMEFVAAFKSKDYEPTTALDWFEREPDDGGKWRMLSGDPNIKSINNHHLKTDSAMELEIMLWNAIKKAAEEKWTLHW